MLSSGPVEISYTTVFDSRTMDAWCCDPRCVSTFPEKVTCYSMTDDSCTGTLSLWNLWRICLVHLQPAPTVELYAIGPPRLQKKGRCSLHMVRRALLVGRIADTLKQCIYLNVAKNTVRYGARQRAVRVGILRNNNHVAPCPPSLLLLFLPPSLLARADREEKLKAENRK